jgi:hypothetical protein
MKYLCHLRAFPTFKMLRFFFVFVLFTKLFIALALFPFNPLHAQEPESKQTGMIKLSQQKQKSQLVQIGEYNGSGIIDAVHKKGIIINDTLFPLVPLLRKFDFKGQPIYKKLEKGLYVYYFLDGRNRVSEIYIED